MTVTSDATVREMDAPTEKQPEYRPFDVAFPDHLFPCCDPVGAMEIAERLGMEARSIHMVGRRGQLPEPDFTVNNSRAWRWAKILWWAGETDRLRLDALCAEYAKTFGHRPPVPRPPRTAPGVNVREDEHPDLPAVPT